MGLPSENAAAPPVWEPSTSFQYSFEDNESTSLWDTYTNVTPASTDGAADGEKYAPLASNGVLVKYINNSAIIWIRFCIRFSATRGADRDLFDLDYGGTPTTLVKLEYLTATDKIKCHLTGKAWSRSSAWQTIEYLLDIAGLAAYIWADGTYIGTAAIADVSAETLRITFGDEATATTFHLDAVRVDTFRAGIPGKITPSIQHPVSEGDVEIDGIPFNILEGQYQEQDISGFAPRMGTGAPAYSDLSGFQHFLIPSLHNGIGQPHMVGEGEGDENRYLLGLGIDTTGQGVIRLANGLGDTDSITSMTAYDAMAAGEIVSCEMSGKSIYGLKFGTAKAPASYTVLAWRNGDALSSKAFTCTDGVRDVLYNGAYLFVTLGGSNVRMQKTADLSTFSNVGNDSLPPVDMGAMAVHDEFLWVADRTTPIVYRSGQTDGSDLAKETVLGIGAHRVGPGSVPINSMCSFGGYLYVGREDGLYAVNQDADFVYVHCVETWPRSIYNCRRMTVHEGYLVFAVGRQVYRLGGISESGLGAKMEITPGPISDDFPYGRILRWDGFTVSNGYLYAVGYDSTGAGYVFCYNGNGWCRLYDTDNVYGAVSYPAGLEACPSSTREPRIHYATCRNTTAEGAGVFYESYASARMGSESPETANQYASSGYFTTSWMSFGLPLVPKLFRQVRLHLEDASYNCPIKVEYYVNTGQEEKSGTLGVLVQNDANALLFPAGTWGTRLKLKFTFTRASGATPVIKRIVVQYMDRPAAVWGYSMTLDLSSPPRTGSGRATSETVETLKQHLRDCREKASYVRFVDVDGNESDVFVSSGPRFTKTYDRDVALVTLMVVKRYINTPGVVGVTTGEADPTYHYVHDTLGSDSNPGTYSQPWKTLAAVTSHTLAPGDTVCLNRGGTFTPATGFAVGQSGSVGNPITFAAYGTGDRPIIVGPAWRNAFDLSNRSYIVVTGIEVQAHANAYTAFNMNPAHHIEITDCEASGSLYGAIYAAGAAASTHDITIANCLVHDGAEFGIICQHTGASGPDSITITGCTSYDNGTNTAAHHGIYLKYTTNALVQGNTCYGNASGGIKINQEGQANACAGTVVDSNYCYENGTGIWMSASEVVYTNNLIYGSVYDGIHVLNDGGDCLVAHNTIVNCFSFGIHLQDNAPGISGYTFKNNIVLQNKAVLGEDRECIRVAGDGTAQAENNVWDYNQYFTDGFTSLVNVQSASSLDLAGWKTLTGQESHSADSDPLFTTEFSDLHLGAGSPAIARGDPTVGILTDKDSVTRGAAVDAGCYEYVA